MIHILTGDEHLPPSFDSLRSRVLEKQRSDFELIVWAGHQRDVGAASVLVDAYSQLEPRNREHFLRSPVVFERISDARFEPSLEGIEKLMKLCSDELIIARRRPERSDIREAIWSPMGDEWLVRTAEGYRVCKSATIGDSIAVDFDSPSALMIDLESVVMCNPPELYGDDEREGIVQNLRDALAHIDRVVPSFGRMIRSFTQVIRIRKSDQAPGFASEEVPARIGEIRILNPHRADCDVNILVEMLVHETVHSMLATHEQVVGPFVLQSSDRRFRPVSPWTGNPIPYESITHAIFVWFALFQFALREHAMPGLSEDDVVRISRQLNRCASGFLLPAPLSVLIAGETPFQRGFYEAVDKLQDIVITIVEDMSAGRLEFLAPVAV